jgi:ADP-dependent NAD(P)H-hydrate dehydratase
MEGSDMPEPEIVTPELLRDWSLPGPTGSKKSRGQLVVIGGAARTPGAVVLGGLSALRVGAGHVQLALAASAAPAVAATFPEVGVAGLTETDGGAVDGQAAAQTCAEMVAGADAVLVGPGLDDADEALRLLDALLERIGDETAVVLDAFALGVLSDVGDRVAALGDRLILTPNADELERLLDGSGAADVEAVREAAVRYHCCVTAQGLVADRNERAWRVPLGHSGLATGGSGDVLAGAVAGLLARGAEPPQAACWATYLHAMAGERLASAVGEVGFLARELVDQLPALLAELT